MKLTDLHPRFLKVVDDHTFHNVDNIADADGICFLCPKCFQENSGPVGTHSIICWQPHVPAGLRPSPGRWKFVGTGFDDLSLVAGSSSILLTGGCQAHFFVTKGLIT